MIKRILLQIVIILFQRQRLYKSTTWTMQKAWRPCNEQSTPTRQNQPSSSISQLTQHRSQKEPAIGDLCFHGVVLPALCTTCIRKLIQAIWFNSFYRIILCTNNLSVLCGCWKVESLTSFY